MIITFIIALLVLCAFVALTGYVVSGLNEFNDRAAMPRLLQCFILAAGFIGLLLK